MTRQRHWLTLGVALTLVGCVVPAHVAPRVHGPAAPVASVDPVGIAGLISDHGNGLLSNNGGSLTGRTKIPTGIVTNNGSSLISEAGGGIIANNGGGIVANNGGGIVANNGGGLVANNGGGLTTKTKLALLAVTAPLAEAPTVGFAVTIVDAAGHPVLDDQGQPYKTTTDNDGAYSFARTPRGANLLVRVELP